MPLTRRHFSACLLGSGAASVLSGRARAQNAPAEGVNYLRLPEPVPVTVPPYARGAFIRNGQFVLDPAKGIPGGGMCSASTTLLRSRLATNGALLEARHRLLVRWQLGAARLST